MPRIKRISDPGVVLHVMNRGNRRNRIFLKTEDYLGFLGILRNANRRFGVRLIDFCLMPNHWHLVLWPSEKDAVSAYMRWVTGTHVRRHHKEYGLVGTGHLYQGRYTAVPVEPDGHLLIVLRYVEANPVRAGLVQRAERWAWSSLGAPEAIRTDLLTEGPARRPPNWLDCVNSPPEDLDSLRQAITRGAPFGSNEWVRSIADEHGLQFTLRRRGRPSHDVTGT